MMKKILVAGCLLLVVCVSYADSYKQLWKQADDYRQKDQPRSEIAVLEKIAEKAEAESAYGQLLKAEVQMIQNWQLISLDSLQAALKRLENKEKQCSDEALDAVYCAVLYKFRDRTNVTNVTDGIDGAEMYRAKALKNPKKLAATKCEAYEPFVLEGNIGKYFLNDLLSVIGYEMGDYATLHDYYDKHGPRSAALLTALEGFKGSRVQDFKTSRGQSTSYQRSEYKLFLDSLEKKYSDLDVCAEVAIKRLEYMDGCKDVKAKDKIDAIHHALNMWADYDRMNVLRNRETELTNPTVQASFDKNLFLSGEEMIVRFSRIRNIPQLTLTFSKTNLTGDNDLSVYRAADLEVIKKSVTGIVLIKNKTFLGRQNYDAFEDSMKIEGLPVGVYLMEISAPKMPSCWRLLNVSDVACIQQALADGRNWVAVVNAKTGHPIPNAKLRATYRNESETKELTTDANGEIIIENGSTDSSTRTLTSLFPFTDDDEFSPKRTNLGDFQNYGTERKRETVKILTDRAIYRPGQTVRASALAYEKQGDEVSVVAGRDVTVVLRDANRKQIAEKTVRTDDFGVAAVDFVLPKNTMNGRFSIMANGNTMTTIRVEEYKRPTFEIVFPEITKKYQNGDTLLVHTRVMTYAGAPVQGAKVTYKVVRKMARWWRWDADEVVMKEETAVTDGEGGFWLKMDMVLPEQVSRCFYNFEAQVMATSISGETHEGTLVVPLGYKKAMLTVNLPKQIERDSLRTMTFNMKNAAGHDVDAMVRYSFDGEKESICQTQQQIAIVPQLQSGEHTLTAYCEDDTLTQRVVVFTKDDEVPCMPTKDWFWVSDSSFPEDPSASSETIPVTIQVGSSEGNLNIYYTMFADGKEVERGSVVRDRALLNKEIQYEKAYGDGVFVAFCWMKNGKIYTHTARISKPLPKKELKLEWETFRDRLIPGQQEEWRLKVSPTHPSQKTDKGIQLAAVLYDKSLDAIVNHSWNLSLSFPRRIPHTNYTYNATNKVNFNSTFAAAYLTTQDIAWNRFDEELFASRHRMVYVNAMRKSVGVRGLTTAAATSNALKEVALNTTDDLMLDGSIGGLDNTVSSSAETTSTAQVRENLNETAFFYPQLLADKDGVATIAFTLPESLTTWRFLGLAHTKDMCYGMIEDEAIAKKDVMVQPNVPRFIRMGDKAAVSASIVNTSNKDITGMAHIELIDPDTETIIWTEGKAFSLKENETTAATFTIDTKDCLKGYSRNNLPLLICKVYASGKGFSDGEQHYLPVLPDKEMVMNTISITQHDSAEAKVDLRKLVDTKDDSNATLTIEYTNNPAWMMVQTLPSIDTPAGNDVISYLRAYYSSRLASHFLRQNPQLKSTIKSWSEETTGETLTSRLMKNEDVKNILLNETPWVNDADTETEWMQKLANYYDENSLNQKLADNLSEIEARQLSDGSWTWFKGMPGSYYMTLSVVEHLARLNLLTASDDNTEIISSGVRWMANETVKMVEEMKKEENKGHKQSFPGGITLQYLYTCAISNVHLTAEQKAGNDYLIALLKNDSRNRSIFEKGLAAIVFHKNGNTNEAKEFIKSLKEYSVYTDEMGRYYDSEKAGYTWRDYKIPTEVSAIEAIWNVTPDDSQTIEEMQRWLLQEKRTQFWATPLNSMDAIYAFMLNNTASLEKKENTKIAIDGKQIDLGKQSAGLGYVKTAINYNGEKELTFNKTSKGTSWGAVYARFMQPVKDVDATGNGITVKRECFLSSNPKAPTTKLKVGDKVKVRITIKSDRDYDFVQIRDKRAACMEPTEQLSGYHHGMYVSPKDTSTDYFLLMLTKGTHVFETEYFIDRVGEYQYAPITVECAYSPDFSARSKTDIINVNQ